MIKTMAEMVAVIDRKVDGSMRYLDRGVLVMEELPGHSLDYKTELMRAANILADYLAGDNDAPLKKAVVGAGLGQELSVDVADGLQQNILSWSVWNTEVEKLPQIRRFSRPVACITIHQVTLAAQPVSKTARMEVFSLSVQSGRNSR